MEDGGFLHEEVNGNLCKKEDSPPDKLFITEAGKT